MFNFMEDYDNLGLLYAIIVLIVSIFVWLACSVVYGVYKTIELIVDIYKTLSNEFYRLYWTVKRRLGF